MELTSLRRVYEHEGPFATVYLEGRAPAEDAGEQRRLRWRSLRERLESQGAEQDALAVAEGAVLEDRPGYTQTNGRVVVATAAGVALDEPWDAALGTGDDAHWGELPELGAYVRESSESVRMLVVVSDKQGAEVRQEVVTEQHLPRQQSREVVSGAREGVHKPRGGALSHNQIQRHAEENAGRNAREIASRLSEIASRFRPEVCVLAGEVQARSSVREELPGELSDMVVESDRGGLGEGASEDALTEELLGVARDVSERRADDQFQRLQYGLAHDEAVQGTELVATSAERGALDTLLLESGAPSVREAMLLKVGSESGASVEVVSSGAGLTDGVGALLRFPINASATT